MMSVDDPHALIIAISGCSSSGKTTLARLLRDIFPNTFILHQDDFYKPEEECVSRVLDPLGPSFFALFFCHFIYEPLP